VRQKPSHPNGPVQATAFDGIFPEFENIEHFGFVLPNLITNTTLERKIFTVLAIGFEASCPHIPNGSALSNKAPEHVASGVTG
jgi:hypothetical protein